MTHPQPPQPPRQATALDHMAARFAADLAKSDYLGAVDALVGVAAEDRGLAATLLEVVLKSTAIEGQRRGRTAVVNQVIDTVAPGSSVVGARIGRVG